MVATHPLKKWIDDNTTQAKFAREIKCSESHLSDILSGRKGVSLDLALRMSKATKRQVSVDAIARRTPSRKVAIEVTGEAAA